MKNILIVTPVYDLKTEKKLVKDTKAVNSLCRYKEKNENLIIIYYYFHTRFNAIKNFFKICFYKKNVENYLHKDDNGNDVLLFEHPCIIPGRDKTFSYFDKKYIKIFNKYLKEKNVKIDSVIVHFPSRLWNFTKMIDSNKRTFILHSFDVQESKRLEYVRDISNYADLIGYRSYNIRNEFLKEFNLQKEDFMCISGVPEEYISKSNFYREWKENNVLKLVFTGKLNKNKNVITILKALNELKNTINFEFTIIGDGKEKENLLKYSGLNNLSNRVKFLGYMDRDSIFKELKKNDIFIMVSKKETLGISYLEAMSQGNIVIGSKGRGIDGIIKNNYNGFLVEPLNIDEIANLLSKVYNFKKSEVDLLRKNTYETINSLTEYKVSRLYLNNAK